MSKVLFINLCVLWCLLALEIRALPSFLKICKRTDPELDACIKNTLEDLSSHLANGIPEMKIPPFDPLHVLELVLDNGNVKLVFKDVELKSMDRFELSSVHFDLEQCKLEINASYSSLFMKSSYVANGKLLLFQLNGEGPFQANFTSEVWSSTMNCKQESENGKDFLKFTDDKFTLNLGGMSIFFGNLFKDNQVLTDTTNAALNENSQALIDGFQTLMGNAIGKVILSIVQTVFNNFPIDVLLPN